MPKIVNMFLGISGEPGGQCRSEVRFDRACTTRLTFTPVVHWKRKHATTMQRDKPGKLKLATLIQFSALIKDEISKPELFIFQDLK